MSQTFCVPCHWELSGTLYIEADTREEAIRKAYSPEVSLPKGEYVADSFRVDEEEVRLYAAPEEESS